MTLQMPKNATEAFNLGFDFGGWPTLATTQYVHTKYNNKMITVIVGIVDVALVPIVAAIKLIIGIFAAIILPIIALCKGKADQRFDMARKVASACLGEIVRSLIDITVIGAIAAYILKPTPRYFQFLTN